MPKPHSPFPDPACRLPDEYPMLAAVLAVPLDDLPKLVYADWLEERADARGPFLRQWVDARQANRRRPKPPKGVSPCWLSVIGYLLDDRLERLGNPAWADAARRTAEPGLLVRTKPLRGKLLPTGASKMGGLPDLVLMNDDWPDGVDGPTALVAQWNLEDLAASPVCRSLPKTGLLSFFIDLQPFVQDSGDGDTAVVYTPDLSELETIPTADSMAEENDLPECRVEFFEWLTLPHRYSPSLEAFRLPADVLSEYTDFYFDFDAPKCSHQILGHAGPIQSDPAPDDRPGWRLLTQFGPDGTLNLEACDGGTWYFMTRPGRAKVWKFDTTYMEFQTA